MCDPIIIFSKTLFDLFPVGDDIQVITTNDRHNILGYKQKVVSYSEITSCIGVPGCEMIIYGDIMDSMSPDCMASKVTVRTIKPDIVTSEFDKIPEFIKLIAPKSYYMHPGETGKKSKSDIIEWCRETIKLIAK